MNNQLEVIHYKNSNQNEYFGQSKNGKKSGIGIMKFNDGRFYLGEYDDKFGNGYECGFGIYFNGRDVKIGYNLNNNFDEKAMTCYSHASRVEASKHRIDGLTAEYMGIKKGQIEDSLSSLFRKLRISQSRKINENNLKLMKEVFNKYKDIYEKSFELSKNDFINYCSLKTKKVLNENNAYALLDSNNKKTFGFYESPNKNKYFGNFKDNKRNGFGVMTFNGGTKYIGNWNNDENLSMYGLENGFGIYKKGATSAGDFYTLGNNRGRDFEYPKMEIITSPGYNSVELFFDKDNCKEIKDSKIIENINKLFSTNFENLSDIKKNNLLEYKKNFEEYEKLTKEISERFNEHTKIINDKKIEEEFVKELKIFEEKYNELDKKEKEFPSYVKLKKRDLENKFIDLYDKFEKKHTSFSSFTSDDLVFDNDENPNENILSINSGLRQAVAEISQIKGGFETFESKNKVGTCFNKYFGLTENKFITKKINLNLMGIIYLIVLYLSSILSY